MQGNTSYGITGEEEKPFSSNLGMMKVRNDVENSRLLGLRRQNDCSLYMVVHGWKKGIMMGTLITTIQAVRNQSPGF